MKIIQKFKTKVVKAGCLLFCVFLSNAPPSNERGIHEMLHAPDTKTLENIIEKQNRRDFLKELCQNQKRFSKIPWGCYELRPFGKQADPFCLKLSVKNLEINSLKKALSLKSLSPACRNHLNRKLKILNYRKGRKEMDTI